MKKIRKIASSIGVLGKILNIFSDSKENTYSCDYINKLNKMTILYENSEGSNIEATWDEEISQFSYIDIEYKCNTYGYKTARIYEPVGKRIVLDYCILANATTIQQASCIWYIDGEYRIGAISSNSTMTNFTIPSTIFSEKGNNLIYITKVIGYK